MKLKATSGDGDNTVMVSSNDGDIKKSSNKATIDAVNTETSGNLKVNGDINVTGSINNINMKSGKWKIDCDDNGLYFHYNGVKIFHFDGVGNMSGASFGNPIGTLGKYAIQSSRGGFLPDKGNWEGKPTSFQNWETMKFHRLAGLTGTDW